MKFINKIKVFETIDRQTEIIDELLQEIDNLSSDHDFLKNYLISFNLGKIICSKFIFILQYLEKSSIDEEMMDIIYYSVIFYLNAGVNELSNTLKYLRLIYDKQGKINNLNLSLIKYIKSYRYIKSYKNSVRNYYNLIYDINFIGLNNLIECLINYFLDNSNYDKNIGFRNLDKILSLRKK